MPDETTLAQEIGGLTEVARSAPTMQAYERFAFERLGHLIGFDVGFFVRAGGPGDFAPGLDERVRRACARCWHVYGRELHPFLSAAMSGGGAAIDRAFFGPELERKAYYREIMVPHHGRSTLIGYLSRRGQVEAKLVLGRTWGSRDFTDEQRRSLVALLPTLSLCDAALRVPTAEPSEVEALGRLTPREREVIQYLQLGYTNREIALACGTAAATVRNQLSSIFAKLGASTRAEAVALSIRSAHHV